MKSLTFWILAILALPTAYYMAHDRLDTLRGELQDARDVASSEDTRLLYSHTLSNVSGSSDSSPELPEPPASFVKTLDRRVLPSPNSAAGRNRPIDPEINRLRFDLAATRAQLMQAGSEKIATQEALKSSDAVVAVRDEALEAARRQASTLIAELAAARHDPAQAREVAKQLESARRAEADLAAVRAQLAQAASEKAAAQDALQSFQAVAVDRDKALGAVKEKASALTAELAAAKHDGDQTAKQLAAARARTVQAVSEKAAAQDALQAFQAVADKALDAVKEKASALAAELAAAKRDAGQAREAAKQVACARGAEAELAAGRAKLAQTASEKTAAQDALQSSQAVAADRENALQAAREKVSTLTAELAAAKHDANQARKMAQQLESGAAANLAAAHARSALAGSKKTATQDTPQSSQAVAVDRDKAIEAELPDGASTRVVLLYPSGSDAAYSRAIAMQSSLRLIGANVTNMIAVPRSTPGIHVSYFFRQDQEAARRISVNLDAPEPSENFVGGDQHPGAIQVSVGG